MQYISTRGRAPKTNFAGTVTAGLASDGGLYLPAEVPKIPPQKFKSLQSSSYARVAYEVLALLAPDFPKSELFRICVEAYTPERFSFGVRGADPALIVPILEVQKGLYLAGLSNGPTQAFKDLGMDFLAPALAKQRKGAARILGATSGDTGSAAIEAFKDYGVPVFMLSPKTGMSRYQQVQMWGVKSPHVFNLVIDAGFTECQNIVKAVFGDQAFRDEYQLMAVNSINWARIAAQICYYVWTYLQMKKRGHDVIDVSVPSGNFGNAFAAYYARAMGVPINRIVVATNENDILDRFFGDGLYIPRPRVVTTSPSMDIETASNLERLLSIVWKDSVQVCQFYEKPERVDPRIFAMSGIKSMSVIEKDVETVMRVWWQKYGVMIDPHTAVAAYASAWNIDREHDTPMVIMETAQPVKFRATVKRVLGIEPPAPHGINVAEFEGRPTFEYHLPLDVGAVKQFIEQHV